MFGNGLIMQVEVIIESAPAFELLRRPAPANCQDVDVWNWKESERIKDVWRVTDSRWRDATWEDQFLLIDLEKERSSALSRGVLDAGTDYVFGKDADS